MLRKIITIDEKKCNGCGLCAEACHEGAIGMRGGKAVLLRDDYCDGLGDCLPVCPTGAITFEERDTLAFDAAAVKANLAAKAAAAAPVFTGCPGSRAQLLERQAPAAAPAASGAEAPSQLRQWPVQIQLVPVKAPHYEGASLLVAADCAAYAHGGFHDQFMQGKVTVIGCPKLDDVDYSQKLAAIIKENNIKSVTVVRMQVPCCGGIEHAVKTALQQSGKMIPWRVVTLAIDGRVLED